MPDAKGIVLHQSPESSLETLIAAGCDNRLVAATDGLNRYGCSPLAREVIPLGSCTCSSPSPRGVRAAQTVLQRCRTAVSPLGEADAICQQHRDRLRSLLRIPGDIDVAFSPSGTDAELLALALVMLRHQRPVVNIIVGPTEVGTGTPLAAAGLHYDTVAPIGRTVLQGMPIAGPIARHVTVRNIKIRDAEGIALEEAIVDATVVQAVSEAVSAGAHVLLHVVAHSKTGIHAPSSDCVSQIARHLAGDVSVVVDAAQGRLSPERLRRWLAAGHQVIFTGSKFYGGPPFSGALFVPKALRPSLADRDSLIGHGVWSAALGAYLSPHDLPPSWTMLRENLIPWVNYGSLLRWAGALAEMDAYFKVPADVRAKILRTFADDVPAVFGDSPCIHLLPSSQRNRFTGDDDSLDSLPSVFPFRVHRQGRMLERESLKALHDRLNRGPAGRTSEFAGPPFHLGQPVSFRDGSAALRIALGAEMIVRVATDTALGSNRDARLDWLRSQLARLRSQVEQWAAASTNTAPV